LEAFDLDAHVEKLTATKIGDAIREKSAEFAKEKEELENAKVKAAEDKAKVEAELSELKEKSEAADAELKELKEKLEAEEQSRVFSERMEALNSEYELGDDEAKVIAKNIKSLDEDAYGNWLEDFKVFAKEKSKDYKAKKKAEFDKMKKEKEDEDKDGDKSKEKDEDKSKASETDEQKEDAEKAIAAAQANANTSPANTQHEAVTNLSDKFKDLKLELAD
jgi:chromosome segregation ATPase